MTHKITDVVAFIEDEFQAGLNQLPDKLMKRFPGITIDQCKHALGAWRKASDAVHDEEISKLEAKLRLTGAQHE
jgi:hypothetical protein